LLLLFFLWWWWLLLSHHSGSAHLVQEEDCVTETNTFTSHPCDLHPC
jgi:hypothetical protein